MVKQQIRERGREIIEAAEDYRKQWARTFGVWDGFEAWFQEQVRENN